MFVGVGGDEVRRRRWDELGSGGKEGLPADRDNPCFSHHHLHHCHDLLSIARYEWPALSLDSR